MSGPTPTTETSPDKPQPKTDRYEIRCICGIAITGDRDNSPQLVECSQCRWEWFVLPKSPYPAPSDEKEKRRKKRLREKRRKEFVKNLALSPVYLTQFTFRQIRNLLSFIIQKIRQVIAAIIRFFTPVRIVFTLISVFLLITVTVMVNNARFTNASKNFREASQSGHAFLSKKELPQAAEQFQKAATALAIIQGTDPYQLDVNYLAKETFALTHLVQDDLLSIARNAHETSTQNGATEWSNLFQYRYKSKWIILDLTLPSANSLELSSDIYQHPLWIDKQLIMLEIPISLLPDSSEPKARAVLAGELYDMQAVDNPQLSDNTSWKLKFRHNSLFLWAHDSTAGFLFFDDGPWLKTEPLKDVLTRQRRQLTLPDASNASHPSTTGGNS